MATGHVCDMGTKINCLLWLAAGFYADTVALMAQAETGGAVAKAAWESCIESGPY